MTAALQVMALLAALALLVFGVVLLLGIVLKRCGYTPKLSETRAPWPEENSDE